jgi:hypothetical protein
MIQDVMKDRKPGDKPRFFLHDELKEWLADNLQVSITSHTHQSLDAFITSRLKVGPIVGHTVSLEVKLAGEVIDIRTTQLMNQDAERTIRHILQLLEAHHRLCQDLRLELAALETRVNTLETKLNNL